MLPVNSSGGIKVNPNSTASGSAYYAETPRLVEDLDRVSNSIISDRNVTWGDGPYDSPYYHPMMMGMALHNGTLPEAAYPMLAYRRRVPQVQNLPSPRACVSSSSSLEPRGPVFNYIGAYALRADLRRREGERLRDVSRNQTLQEESLVRLPSQTSEESGRVGGKRGHKWLAILLGCCKKKSD